MLKKSEISASAVKPSHIGSAVLATPKIQVLAAGLVLVAIFPLWLIFTHFIVTTKSVWTEIAKVALGVSCLAIDPPALHKPYYGFGAGITFLFHGAYRLFHG